ncbi:pseudouridine synthase [Paraburkholderia sp. LEh10]|uniref:pseudouridine synthase n=1 Tax=Paraburkholderia sp. LEh10 TaxID=2821353 RepID=UPI001AE79541|nr:pseudouridine synthase [Paraburkholderia sp. LEh10]MBP0589101.1 pseudouridine synthase [Paraburkholderia sp. LEh10]
MRVKLTAKHPRPASAERTPVRPGSSTARKPTRPAAKATSSAGPRERAGSSTGPSDGSRGAASSGEAASRPARKTAGTAGERRGPSTATRSGAPARATARPARASGAPGAASAREGSAAGSYERRSTTDRPARKDGAAASGGFRRDAGARTDRPSRGAGAASTGERAPRFSRDSEARGTRRVPRDGEERRTTPRAPRTADGAPPRERAERRTRGDADGARDTFATRTPRERGESPRARHTDERGGFDARRPRSEGAPRRAAGERSSDTRSERSYARPVNATYQSRNGPSERRPRGEGVTQRARSDDAEAHGERRYAKPVKGGYAERDDDASRKAAPAPRASKAKRDTRSLEDSFDRPARFNRPAEKPARKSRPAAEPRHRDEGEYNDAPGNLRLSKLMSELGLCSRREADEWIEKGWVKVDGVVVDTLGTKVRPDADIQIDPAAQAAQLKQVTILVHKPVGYVSGQAEDGYEPAVTLVKPENRWDGDRTDIRFSAAHLRQLAPAGRLDIDSTGLLVLTQDGRIAKQLIGGHSEVDKEYLVRVAFGDIETDVEHQFPAESLAKLRHGLELDGVPLKPAMVSWQNGEQLRFVLREGKKRQIRRMCELVGLHVVGLKRVRMGHVMLGALPPGQWRYLGPDESF